LPAARRLNLLGLEGQIRHGGSFCGELLLMLFALFATVLA
jgi:hypothetical protein